jgi:antitoxin VapB
MKLLIPAEVEELVRQIAAKTGVSPDSVVREAVEVRAKALGLLAPRQRRFDEAKIRAIIERITALPVLDIRSDEEILGYNENGAWS